MSERKPTQQSQREISQAQINPYLNQGKEPLSDKRSRVRQISYKDDTEKTFTVTLQDIDETILYYFQNVIRPSVMQNGEKLNVPIIYGSPERWASVQKDGFYRDKNGKIQVPLIMVKRDTVTKNRALGNKLDGNEVKNFIVTRQKYSKRNIYDRFSILTNREPEYEVVASVVPDYVTINYTCIAFTDYSEQMNKIVEAINFASDSYWGEPERFKFQAMIDSFTTVTELNQGQDRGVKTTFNIKLNGYIITDTINKEMANLTKWSSKSQLLFSAETADSSQQLEQQTQNALRSDAVRFYDGQLNTTILAGMTTEEILYVSLRSAAVADSVSGNTATFLNKTIATAPIGFNPVGLSDFEVYFNGRRVPLHQLTSIVQNGTDTVLTIDTPAFLELAGAVIEPEDEILLIGKFS